MTETFRNQLLHESEGMGITLEDRQVNQLFTYYEMLVKKNEVMNLTAITEEHEVVTKHFVDSMGLVKASAYVSRETLNGMRLIDVGTGAGFPGLVLKILFPGLQVTLSDSLMKRLRFLDEVIDALELKGIETLHGRAEDLGRDKRYREKFDVATARAVANLSILAEYNLPFVRKGGFFIPYKSGEIFQECEGARFAIVQLGGKLLEQIQYMLPDSDISRSLVVVQKTKETPKQYPRKAGTPARQPLGDAV